MPRTPKTNIPHLERTALPHIGKLIRELRLGQRISARELARRLHIDARTLNAVEKGRIVSPSIERLHAFASGLGLSLGQLFAMYETQNGGRLMDANPQGAFVVNVPKRGFKLFSYTPPVREIFCGKMILGGRKKLENTKFSFPVTIFIQLIIGRVILNYPPSERVLKEGEAVLFDGRYAFTLVNPAARDASFLFFTAPAPWGESFFRR